MPKLKKLKIALIALAVILASIYLTFLIDTYTLNTWLKRVFIFCYFIIMSALLYHLYFRMCKHKNTWIPLLCAIVATLLGQSVLLPAASEYTVYVQAVDIEEGEEEKFSEVWLVDIEVDGHFQRLSELDVQDTTLWTYGADHDDYYFRPVSDSAINVFSFTVVGEKINLHFGANTWSGKVRVFDGEGYDEVIDLYSEDAEHDRLTHSLSTRRSYSVPERILYSTGAAVVACFLFKLLFSLVCHYVYKKKDAPIKAQNDN